MEGCLAVRNPELGARYRSDTTREWLATFTRHPNAPVANLAKRLFDAQGD